MDLEFTGALVHWRGPAPWYFVQVPPQACEVLEDVAPAITYGWGMVPATVHLGAAEFTTSLWPREGGFVVPVKAQVRRAEGLRLGDLVAVRLVLEV